MGKEKRNIRWPLSWVPIIYWGSDVIFVDCNTGKVGLNCHDLEFDLDSWMFSNLSDCILASSMLFKIYSSYDMLTLCEISEGKRKKLTSDAVHSLDVGINHEEISKFMETML